MSANSRKVSPLAWVPTLYFAMGLPFIIVNMVATLMFRGLGIDDARITLWTSLIILPWSLKPFWSPLMEMFRTKKFWVVATQLVSGLGLALVALSLPLPNFFPYAIALMAVVAFSGATHDIATDGVYITELSKDLQAKFIGWQGAITIWCMENGEASWHFPISRSQSARNSSVVSSIFSGIVLPFSRGNVLVPRPA